MREADGLFANKYLPKVFAALGTELDGASTAEVKRRTSFSEETISTSLKTLEDLGLVVRKGIHFYPQVSHPSLRNLNSETEFKKYFKANLDEIYTKQTYIGCHSLDSVIPNQLVGRKL